MVTSGEREEVRDSIGVGDTDQYAIKKKKQQGYIIQMENIANIL